MPFTLPELPFAKNALEPHMSSRTFDFHYGKHHAGYVKKLNAGIDGTKFADMSLVDTIRATAKDGENTGVFNNAAQTWNHTFFWNSMSPNGGGEPSGALADKIQASFGSLDNFKDKFADAAASQFGSGWAWLVENNGQLEIWTTSNAKTPITEDGVKPLITLDVWEHAYYLDYQNGRPDFIRAFLDHLINWEFAARNLAVE